MRHALRHVADVTRLVVECARGRLEANTVIRDWPAMWYCSSSEFGCQCSSRMPPGSTSTSPAAIVVAAGNLEESTIRTLPPFVSDRLLGHQPVAVARGHRPRAGDPIRVERARHLRLEDVQLLLGDAGKRAVGHAEVLGQDLFRGVGQPVRDQERRLLAEIAVVEDEQELAAVALQSLDRVGDAGREVPDVALADIVLEGVAFLVDGGDPRPGP